MTESCCSNGERLIEAQGDLEFSQRRLDLTILAGERKVATLEQECRDRECTEADVRARLADAENALARVEALASGAEAWARAHPPLFSDAQFPAIVQVSDLRAALDGKR